MKKHGGLRKRIYINSTSLLIIAQMMIPAAYATEKNDNYTHIKPYYSTHHNKKMGSQSSSHIGTKKISKHEIYSHQNKVMHRHAHSVALSHHTAKNQNHKKIVSHLSSQDSQAEMTPRRLKHRTVIDTPIASSEQPSHKNKMHNANAHHLISHHPTIGKNETLLVDTPTKHSDNATTSPEQSHKNKSIHHTKKHIFTKNHTTITKKETMVVETNLPEDSDSEASNAKQPLHKNNVIHQIKKQLLTANNSSIAKKHIMPAENDDSEDTDNNITNTKHSSLNSEAMHHTKKHMLTANNSSIARKPIMLAENDAGEYIDSNITSTKHSSLNSEAMHQTKKPILTENNSSIARKHIVLAENDSSEDTNGKEAIHHTKQHIFKLHHPTIAKKDNLPEASNPPTKENMHPHTSNMFPKNPSLTHYHRYNSYSSPRGCFSPCPGICPQYYIGAYGGYGKIEKMLNEDGDFPMGRLALGIDVFSSNLVSLGFELGLQNGKLMRHAPAKNDPAVEADLPIQTQLNPIVDLLGTVRTHLSPCSPFFILLKGGVAYRRLNFPNVTFISTLSQYNGEAQAGFGFDISSRARLVAFYQGIYANGHTQFVRSSSGRVKVSNIPIQTAGFLGFELSL